MTLRIGTTGWEPGLRSGGVGRGRVTVTSDSWESPHDPAYPVANRWTPAVSLP